MNTSVFFGGSVVAAVVAGMIALFAPCCISVMLPAYFAGSFQNRRVLVAMTFVFAAGVATIILPIALGAAAFHRLFTAQHTIIFLAGGLFMLGLAAYTLLGGQIHLPMPGMSSRRRSGVIAVYALGAFSGVASSCCAPVLAGVIALSGLASSFALALALGTAYVFGMVAPLFVIAVLWDRKDWRTSRLFRPRTFTWRVGPLRRTLTGTNLASGSLLALMGGATIWVALTGPSMPAGTGWQAALSARLQHYGKVMTEALSWIPGWAAVLILVVVIALLARLAVKQVRRDAQESTAADVASSTEGEKEIEYQDG